MNKYQEIKKEMNKIVQIISEECAKHKICQDYHGRPFYDENIQSYFIDRHIDSLTNPRYWWYENKNRRGREALFFFYQ